jgi:hypothetical protein
LIKGAGHARGASTIAEMDTTVLVLHRDQFLAMKPEEELEEDTGSHLFHNVLPTNPRSLIGSEVRQ